LWLISIVCIYITFRFSKVV